MSDNNKHWQPQYDSADVALEADKLLAQSFYQYRQLTVTHRSFSGEKITVQRDLFWRPNAVAVLLYDAQADKVVMIEQFRIGTYDHPRSPWLLELVAGIIEPGEELTEVANRECLEETGLQIGQLQHIFKFTPSPGGVREYIDLFCASVNSAQAVGLHGLAEEGEDIKVHVFDSEQAFSMLQSGDIDNAPAIIALQWLQLHRQSLQDAWR
ncbi:MAG: NUDIX domain-containing protein [Pseudomonadales bacterium]|nr:NUDIX domain-containing protein [Pseudomonadales bacterium]NRA15311.1 NUDIX domain-containing protein [Oceanospirillaceae bacterium]